LLEGGVSRRAYFFTRSTGDALMSAEPEKETRTKRFLALFQRSLTDRYHSVIPPIPEKPLPAGSKRYLIVELPEGYGDEDELFMAGVLKKTIEKEFPTAVLHDHVRGVAHNLIQQLL
jgi:hypothetical protein